MKRCLFIFFIITAVSFAQKEANIWYFGEFAGLDFNSGSPVALNDGMLFTNEGCATISDANGDLLFYTDGVVVFNRNHELMQNGMDLKGHSSSTQSSIIIPKPNDPNIYYIFTPDFQSDFYGLNYSEVNMTLDFGLGGITSVKNVLLLSAATEKVSAVQHANGTDFWVITHGWQNNSFYSFLVSSTGVNLTPVISNTGPIITGVLGNRIGVLKISPKGDKLVLCNHNLGSQLYDFDNSNGEVSNPIVLSNRPFDYGAEFSPSGNVLYTSYINSGGLFQYDLNASDIRSTELEITDDNAPRQMQLGPDQKIYTAQSPLTYVGVINFPDNLGFACDYVKNAVPLNGGRCLAGLPQFIQSYFNFGAFDYDNICFGDTTTFKLDDTVDTIVWDFGDPASGINNTSTDFEPTHVFTSPGTYTVSITVTSGSETATSEQDVIIYELPTATKPQDILACDTDNDGFYNFDLTQQDTNILNGLDPSVFQVKYYATIADYASNSPISNPLSYENQLAYAQEPIIAVVRNKSKTTCDDITSFDIQVFESPMPNQSISKTAFCDNTSFGTDIDGRISFDLTQKEIEILNGQSASNFSITYFTDAALLNEIPNPTNYINSNTQETIHIQVSNNANLECVSNTSMQIEVLELPVVTSIVDLKQCDDDLDGFSFFNLNEVIPELTTNFSNETITFHENLADADTGNSPILNVTNYINKVVSNDAVWARVENNNLCFRISEVNLIVSTTQIPLNFMRDFYKCDDDIDGDITNGISAFDFSMLNSEIEAIFPVGQQLIINYYRNQADALAETNPITDISNYRNSGYPNLQDVYIRVDSAVDNDCLGLGHHITLHVEKQPVAYPVLIPEQCDDDGDTMYAFDTSNIETTILNGQIGMAVSYIDAQGNPLPSPLPNPFLTSSQTVTAIVENTTSQDLDGACFDETTIEFIVDAAAVAYLVEDLIECDDDNDGLFLFNTSNIETTLLNGQTNMFVVYTDENGLILPSPLPNPFLSSSKTITARVENPLSNICYDETFFKLVVVEQPILNMNDTWLICEDESVNVYADEGFDEYLWSTGETSSNITVFEAGNYEVTATNIYEDIRCETSKTITVIESNSATITNIETEDWTQNDNVISVFVEGLGDYEYSLDGTIYQDDSMFRNLKIDNYTVYVRDKKGCGVIEEDVFLMYYPKYFTPNNDGINDTWHIYNSNLEPNNKIYIYDRYGKLLKELTPNSLGWNGTINGEMMPTSDYWFVVNRQNGNQYKGHFTLKR